MSNTDTYIIIGGTIAAIILTYLKSKYLTSESQKEYPRRSENRRKTKGQKEPQTQDSSQ